MPVRNFGPAAPACSASFSRDGNAGGRHGVIMGDRRNSGQRWRKAMRRRYWQRALIGVSVASALTGAAFAQQPPVRVRGEIEKVDGNTLTVKARDGVQLTIAVPDNV